MIGYFHKICGYDKSCQQYASSFKCFVLFGNELPCSCGYYVLCMMYDIKCLMFFIVFSNWC